MRLNMTEINISTVSVDELKNQLDKNQSLHLIDVREPHEWEEVHIPQAVLIPKDQIEQSIERSVPDKNSPIYIHCRSGMRSLYAAECLMNMGYQKVYSVDGGIIQWELKGYTVKRSM